ncbi:MAG: acyl carrier protein [Tissierellia bacterium]|nr:acyl carrier protein [Tissierellia bacterium]
MKEEILKIIAELFNVSVEDLDEETSLENDLNADSIDLMELVLGLEEEYDIEINEDDFQEVETIGDILDRIEKYTDFYGQD